MNDASAVVGPRTIVGAWWPLAASWMLMAAEQPAIAAVVARLADPEVHLAAWGGVVFAFALVIESPIIMMLAASTELCRDRASYLSLGRVVHGLSAALTAVHLLLVATPLYGIVVGDLLQVPPAVLGPARIGLALVLPWTWSIAWRRFNQGILIRFGHARAVGLGTSVRLGTTASVLALGWLARGPGVVVAASALASGVLAEAIYAALRVRPIVRERLARDQPGETPLRGRAFWAFYVPLALTPLVTLVVQPLGTAAVARMSLPLASLAAWPVVNGLAFFLAAPGLALNEVVVALWQRPGARAELWRFTVRLSWASTAVVLLMAATPFSQVWFEHVAALSPSLAPLAEIGLWLIVPVPAARVLQSWYQGLLVASRRTRPVSEAVVVFAVVSVLLLAVAVVLDRWPGLHAALFAFVIGRVAQTGWLALRCRTAAAQ
jgi:hypothetical protein